MKHYPTLTLALLIVFGSISCKKEKQTQNNTAEISVDFDGTTKKFQTVFASKNDLSIFYSLSISGVTGSESLSILLYSSDGNWASGQTYEIVAENGSMSTANAVTYAANVTSMDPQFLWSSSAVTNVEEHFTCTLTEVTSEYVKGTFSADIYQNVTSAPPKKHLTNGKFYARFQ
ncbi:MAG: hypothetical protein H3C48_14480 [Chitinophagaceae bacterium]|nr:hypothetical protein [Chitinophagaceae bacterium]